MQERRLVRARPSENGAAISSEVSAFPSRLFEAIYKTPTTFALNSFKVLAPVGVALSFLTAWVDLQPKISIAVAATAARTDFLSSQFEVINNSSLPIHDVFFGCKINMVHTASGGMIAFSLGMEGKRKIREIAAGGKVAVSCPTGVSTNDPIVDANLDLLVFYTPIASWWLWKNGESFNVSTIPDDGGKPVWVINRK